MKDIVATLRAFYRACGGSLELCLVIAIVSLCAGCAGGLPDPKVIQQDVKDVSTEITNDAVEAKTVVDSLHGLAFAYFLLRPDAAKQAEVEQVFADVNLALGAAMLASQGANSTASEAYDQAFAQFRGAYAKLVRILQDIGVVKAKNAAGKMAAPRGNAGVAAEVPEPRAMRVRGKS